MTHPAKSPGKSSPPPEPLDVHEGMPDTAAKRPIWPYLVIATIFAGWLAFLVYVYLAARV